MKSLGFFTRGIVMGDVMVARLTTSLTSIQYAVHILSDMTFRCVFKISQIFSRGTNYCHIRQYMYLHPNGFHPTGKYRSIKELTTLTRVKSSKLSIAQL